MNHDKLTAKEFSDLTAARSQELAQEIDWRNSRAAQNVARTMRLATRVSYSGKVRSLHMRRAWPGLLGLACAIVVTLVALVILRGVK